VIGEYWSSGPCDDTGGGSVGCGGSDDEGEGRPSVPVENIQVTLEHKGTVVREQVVDANEDHEFRVKIDTDGLTPGEYKIVTSADRIPLRIDKS
jgi:hypothetical protein